jgi:uncharacterized protein YdhG (YjbR/CyaY superfamily)
MPKDDQQTFSEQEREAMRERAQELKKGKKNGEEAVQEKIAMMTPEEQVVANGLHALVKSLAPHLMVKTWYSMPAYATKEGKVVCFFQAASKFDSRYSTLGFGDAANLDSGAMWATTFALTAWGPEEEVAVRALVLKAIS